MTERRLSDNPSYRAARKTIARRALSLAPTDVRQHRPSVLRGETTASWKMVSAPRGELIDLNPRPTASVGVLDTSGCDLCPVDLVALSVVLADPTQNEDIMFSISLTKAGAACLAEALAKLAA